MRAVIVGAVAADGLPDRLVWRPSRGGLQDRCGVLQASMLHGPAEGGDGAGGPLWGVWSLSGRIEWRNRRWPDAG
jgi:hypothetical protein